jgi:UDP-N-acetylmuramoyl-L-alanyl-D-glutamate--2,6-diaminopimelate ligase
VTGTNGKTTVATLLYQLFNNMGERAGLISTIDVRTPDRTLGSGLTTPDAGELRRYMAQMVEDGCQYVFMEVSSHALDQQRTIDLDFDLAIFTNISRDHLDYHGDFRNYLSAKKILFDQLSGESIALVNKDDKNGSIMLQNCSARKYSYGVKSAADFKAKILEDTLEGLHLRIQEHEVFTRLTGDFNAENLLAVFSTAVLLGKPEDKVLTALSGLGPIEGRMEVVADPVTGLRAIVDYAHSPDALEKLMTTVRAVCGEGKIILVVGCGGDRDKGKRPQMAQIACSLSDQLILTSDNPRTEDPMRIIEDMMKGVNEDCKLNLLTIVDRKQAIKTACRLTTNRDVVVVAGKGHETYQEINGMRHPFDDREIIRNEFEAMKTIKK